MQRFVNRRKLGVLVALLLAAMAMYVLAGRLQRGRAAQRQVALLRSASTTARSALAELREAGLASVGYARRFRRSETALVERELPAGVHVFPDLGREERSAVLWVTPQDRALIGRDLLADPVRRPVLERARDTGAAARSSSGDFICLPVYRGGATPATLEERRADVAGWAFGSPY